MLDEAIQGGVGAEASDQPTAVGRGAETRDILAACSLDVAPRIAVADLAVEWVGLMESVLPARDQYLAPEPRADWGSDSNGYCWRIRLAVEQAEFLCP